MKRNFQEVLKILSITVMSSRSGPFGAGHQWGRSVGYPALSSCYRREACPVCQDMNPHVSQYIRYSMHWADTPDWINLFVLSIMLEISASAVYLLS